jgi:competence protein ComEC
MVATGLAVEIALIPLALYHFHRAGLYGIGANLIAIPLTTFIIMPLEAGALLLDAVGLGAPLWFLTGKAIALLLWLAHSVANAKGAVAMLASMPTLAFALMIAGGLWLCLWTTVARLAGIVPLTVGALLAVVAPTSDLLISGDGRHLALVRDGGAPLLLRDRTGDFMREVMAESAGFDGDPGALAADPLSSCSRDSCIVEVRDGSRNWRVLATRSAHLLEWREMIAACDATDIAVSDRRLPPQCQPRWLKLDRPKLQETGAIALYLEGTPRIDSVAERLGQHPWATPPQKAAMAPRLKWRRQDNAAVRN